jgi:hypothetical protein
VGEVHGGGRWKVMESRNDVELTSRRKWREVEGRRRGREEGGGVGRVEGERERESKNRMCIKNTRLQARLLALASARRHEKFTSCPGSYCNLRWRNSREI